MNKNNIIAKFEGDSKFEFFIEKAFIDPAQNTDGLRWIVTGVASTQNVDHDGERMSAPALAQMANIINEKSVPLRYEHDKDPKSIIGKVFEASIDNAKKLVIKAELDQKNVTAKALWDGLQTGSKLGLSVGGRVKRAFRELAEGVGKVIKTFYDVELEEVSITPRPANYDAWLIDHAFAKSYNETPEFYDDFRFYNKFLIDNPQLDYLAVFEKSINDKWVTKVDSNNSQNKSMKINRETPSSSGKEVISTSDLTGTIDSTHKETEETMMEEGKEKTNSKENDTKVTEPVSSTEGLATKSYVDQKFAELTGLLKQISKSLTYTDSDISANDSENPDKPKVNTEEQHAKNRVKAETPEESTESMKTSDSEESKGGKEKAREGQDNTYADGDTGSEKEPLAPGTAHQQDMPDENAVTTEQQHAKNRVKADQTGAERQRGEDKTSESVDAVDSEMPTKPKVNTEENKAKADSETNGHEEDETMKTDSETDSKTSEGEETNKYGHDYMMPELQRAMTKARASNSDPMGVFVYFITKALEDIKQELQSTNKRVLGLEPRFAEMIRTNPEIQKSMKEWMTPAARKGMAINSGRPVLTTREGGRYELMAKEVGEDVRKSAEGKDFKTLYQSQFSSQGKIGE